MLRRNFFLRNSEFLYKKKLDRAEKTQQQADQFTNVFKRQFQIITDHPIAVNMAAFVFIAGVLYYDYHYSFNGILPVLNPITHLQYNLQSGDNATPTGTTSESFGKLPSTAEYIRSNLHQRIEEEKQVYKLKNHNVTGSDPLHKSEAEIALMGKDIKHPHGMIIDGNVQQEQRSEQQQQLNAGTNSDNNNGSTKRPFDPNGEKVSPFKMNVIAGHLDHRENFWNLRNNERNWSIMAQDRQRQQDNYLYRKERAKDDDYGRQSFVS